MRTALAPCTASALALLLFCACGGDDDGVDLVGDTPAEAADEVATASCERRVECGGWDYEIETDENDNVTACTPIAVEVEYDACVSENRAAVRDDLECAMPTDDEMAEFAACINDIIAQDCVSQEQVDAYCDDLIAGEDPDGPVDSPASCDALLVIFEGC